MRRTSHGYFREDSDYFFRCTSNSPIAYAFFLTFQARKKRSIQIMVRFSKGELVQYVPFGSATHAGRFQNKGRILDPIIDTTNSFTGAYMVPPQLHMFSNFFSVVIKANFCFLFFFLQVQDRNRGGRKEHLVREEDIIMSLEPFLQ